MLINVNSAKCIGIEAVVVTVEVDITFGIGIHLVGLADTAVKESLLRTVTALQAVGFHIPGKKIVINLAPADLHKSGSGYDLPIAIGIIAASGQRTMPGIGKHVIMGELGLDGSVRPIPGALPFADLARKEGFEGCILPSESAVEAMELDGISVFGVRKLDEVIGILEENQDCTHLLVRNRQPYGCGSGRTETDIPDFADIIGQDGAKRGIEIAVSGNHNLAMIGPPGSGKSSLAKAIPGIMPPMDREESLLTSKIYSIAGKGDTGLGLIRERPFRAPHYSASLPAIIGGGGGDGIVPGEVSLACGGVLFLDEVGQMPRSVMEALRGPLEDRKVTISRLRSKVEYPASFMLVAASNPCPCGYWGDGDRCTCTPTQRMNYLSRLSGPIMDRIDIQLNVRAVPPDLIASSRKAESSSSVAGRVAAARAVQAARFSSEQFRTNAEMGNRHIEKYCPLSGDCVRTLHNLMKKSGFSMRAYFRIIKVARTIADLAGCADIEPQHLLEAASFRFLDKRSM